MVCGSLGRGCGGVYRAATRQGRAFFSSLPESLGQASDSADVRDALRFERRGHICTRGLLTPAEMAAVTPAVRAAWDQAAAERHCETMDGEAREFAPFLQNFNPHRRSALLLALASSRRLTSVARLLLFDGQDETRLRLYQTAIFAKRAGHDETAWHTDLGTAPVDTNSMVTVWLPLERVPGREDGGTALIFARGSHRDMGGLWYSNLLLDDGHGGAGASGLSKQETARYGEPEDHGALEAGDATWHHG